MTAGGDLETFRTQVREWLAARPIPRVADDLDTRFDELRRWQHELYEAGFVGIAWPMEWGGRGLSVQHQQAFTDELAAARAPQPIGLIGLDVVGPSIARYAPPALRDRLMRPLLSGEEIWCQGFSEPGAGSDLASLSTRAARDGDHFVVNGQKTWTSWAHKARWCALLARTDPDLARHRGISYLVADMRSPGITVRPVPQMTGESEFCEVFFDDVQVPVNHLVGELNGGWRIAMDTLGHERGGFALRRRVEISAPFDDAIAALRRSLAQSGAQLPESLVEEIGACTAALRALRAQTWASLRRQENNDGPSALDSVDKLVMSHIEQRVFGTLRELVGAFATVVDTQVHGLSTGPILHDYLYGRAGTIYGGSAEIQRNIIAERHLKLPRD